MLRGIKTALLRQGIRVETDCLSMGLEKAPFKDRRETDKGRIGPVGISKCERDPGTQSITA